MSDTLMLQSPLEGQIQSGRHLDLSVQELPGIAQFQVISRKGKSAVLGKKVAGLLARKNALTSLEGAEAGGFFICGPGPGEYWVFAEKPGARDVETMLDKELGETASLFDQSHGRIVLRIEGPRATDVLAKGTPLDFHPTAFPAQGAAHTVIAHIPALVAQRAGLGCYDISVPRSYGLSFITWLTEAGDVSDREGLSRAITGAAAS